MRPTNVVFLPRYTAFYGATTFSTAPINARGFAKALLTVWAALGVGSSSAVMKLEESTDLELWHQVGGTFTPGAGEVTGARDLTLEWIRLTVTVSGSPPGISTWAVGMLVPRDT